MERRRPARDLEPGRDRRGGLHERSAQHHDARVAPGMIAEPTDGRGENAVGVGETRLHAEDQGGIEDVLARRPVVHEGCRACVGPRDLLREGLDQRHRQRARPLALARDRFWRRPQIRARFRDDARGLGGNDAGVGFGLGERALEIEHRPHERFGRQRPSERIASEAPSDDVHGDPRSLVRAR